MAIDTPVLELTGIAKHYGATCALRDVTLRLRPGSVHALLGENGAGKSTLVRIIVGATGADRGTIRLDGSAVDLRSVSEAISAGIVPIYQHLSLFPHLSIRENLSAFSLGGGSGFRLGRALLPRAVATAWLAAVGLDLDPDQPVGDLSLGERQLVEIARGLGQNCRVLVLDEPTAALGSEEAGRLFTVVRRLCETGTAVLFISHRFDEIEDLADTVTVLRDGRSVIEGQPLADHGRDELVQAMLGAAVSQATRRLNMVRETVLCASGLRLTPTGPALDVEVRAGEILGLAGLVGCGALPIASALAGALPATGTIRVSGVTVQPGDRSAALSLGVGYVPSDRHRDGAFPHLSALANASASSLAEDTRFALVSHRAEAGRMSPWLRRLKLHPFDLDRRITAFSGGNQQKILVARVLALPGLRLIVLLEPTRGVDIGARETIHDAIVEAAARGVAVVLASSDLDEVVALSHRIQVIREGAVAATFARDVERSALLAAFAGKRRAA